MEAIRALEESIRLKSNFPRSHAELGRLLLKEGKVDRAIAELKIATDLDPSDSGPLYQLGQAYRRNGQKAEAEAVLARVAQLHSPEHDLDVRQELKRLVRLDSAQSEAQAKP
jgi:Flp pilus assembly protein TadD